MFFKTSRGMCTLYIASVLLLSLPACSSVRLFHLKSDASGDYTALLDLEFLMTVSVTRRGLDVDDTQLTEINVSEVYLDDLPMHAKSKTISFIFKRADNVEMGTLTYTFNNGEDGVSLLKTIRIVPEAMFPRLVSPLDNVSLRQESGALEDLGDHLTPYLCNREQTLSFHQASWSTDGYTYSATLRTDFIEAQVFNVLHGQYSPGVPNTCEALKATKSWTCYYIVGGVAAAGLLIAVVVAVVICNTRRSRNKFVHMQEQQNVIHPAVITWDTEKSKQAPATPSEKY